jgi:putative ABC transport system substrate-binding protein
MRLTKSGLIGTLALGILAAPLAADAQPPVKVPRIGWLFTGDPARLPPLEGFRQGLRELGYVEGQNIVIELRAAEGRYERLPQLARELMSLKPDLVVAVATPSAIAARDATRTIPIVMVAVGDPVGTGLVSSLARPGGNITGVSLVNVEFSGKRLQLLKEALPKVSRVAILWNSLNAMNASVLEQTQVAAAALGVTLLPLSVRAPEDLPSALAATNRERAGALIVVPDSMLLSHRRSIIDFAAKNCLPAMYNFIEETEDGGLMSYGASLYENYRRAAAYVDKILKGAKPGDLPVEQPTKLELVINLKTAKAIGLRIPQSLLIRADHVIQ